ncbi:SMI1/KNR4 family protein [Streptomyces sp. NPDC001070]
MNQRLRELLGPPQRWRPAGAAAWAEIEKWLGCALPVDFKEFVDEYGDCRIREFLGVAHPAGRTPLLECMKEDRAALEESADQYRDPTGSLPFDPATAVGWGSHDYDGDLCFFLPREKGEWAVMVAFRQRRQVLIVEGGFTAFMIDLLSGERVPYGWPAVGPVWRSLEDSPVI